MRHTTLEKISFRVEREGEMVILSLIDFIELGPNRIPVEVVRVPFDAEAWPKFQRRVATEGAGAGIETARIIPSL